MSYAIINLKKRRIFEKIEVNYVCDELQINVPEFKRRNEQKYAKKISKILKKHKINNVVLSNELKQLVDFENIIIQNNNYIITGKKIYKVLLPQIIKDISNLVNFECEKMNLALLIDEYNADNVELIKILADEVKSLTLITNNAYRFEQIVDELLRDKGIVVQLANNGKINLKRRQLIINLDFSSMDIGKLNLPNEAVIITNNTEIPKIKNSFNGIIIKDIDIYLNKNVKEFRNLELCEAYIYNYMKRIKENELLFNRSTYKINGYIGNNGKIEQSDFERIGRIFLKNKKQSAKNNT